MFVVDETVIDGTSEKDQFARRGTTAREQTGRRLNPGGKIPESRYGRKQLAIDVGHVCSGDDQRSRSKLAPMGG